LHKKRNSALPKFGAIALCSFLHVELCPGHNSQTTRDINKKYFFCVQNLFGEHLPLNPALVLPHDTIDPIPPLNIRKKPNQYIAGACYILLEFLSYMNEVEKLYCYISTQFLNPKWKCTVCNRLERRKKKLTAMR
jgi:hypothetical protein